MTTKKRSFLTLCLLLFLTVTHYFGLAQNIEWQKCYGGTSHDRGYKILLTNDGGYICAGVTYSNDGDVQGNHGTTSFDGWLVKVNSVGVLEWQKCFGGSANEQWHSIEHTPDGGYIACLLTVSQNGDVVGNHGLFDVWVIRLDSLGNIKWKKCYGGSNRDSPYCLKPTPDGGFIVTAHIESQDGDVSGNTWSAATWVFKADSLGTIEWQNFYEKPALGVAYLYDIQLTPDGGYILLGDTCDIFSGNCANTTQNVWVVKLNSAGNYQWSRAYGGTIRENSRSIRNTLDGNYIFTASTTSNDLQVSNNHGDSDAWVVKIDTIGNILWQTCLGGSFSETSPTIEPTNDGGYILQSSTNSQDGDVSGYHISTTYKPDIWLVKLNSQGAIEWQKCLGGTGQDEAIDIKPHSDGGYIIAGLTESNDGDVSGVHGTFDMWLIKITGKNTAIPATVKLSEFSVNPNPIVNEQLHISYTLLATTEVEMSLLDVVGNVVQHENSKMESVGKYEKTMSLEGLSRGIYLLKINTNNGSWTTKVLKY